MTETQAIYQANSTDWRTILNDRQRQELELARFYATKLAHGTAGHNRLMLVDRLAELLDARGTDAPVPQPVLKFNVLDVPYHSQHEADAKKFRKDCGPACVEMVGEFYKPDTDVTTDAIMKWITAEGGDRGIWIKELQNAAKHFYSVTLERQQGLWDEATVWHDLQRWIIDEHKPAIVLVHYGSFATRMDRNYTAGHYLVVVGFDEIQYQNETIERVIVHDPDFYARLEAQGAFIPIVRKHFMKMWNDCHKDRNPRCMALVPVEGA